MKEKIARKQVLKEMELNNYTKDRFIDVMLRLEFGNLISYLDDKSVFMGSKSSKQIVIWLKNLLDGIIDSEYDPFRIYGNCIEYVSTGSYPGATVFHFQYIQIGIEDEIPSADEHDCIPYALKHNLKWKNIDLVVIFEAGKICDIRPALSFITKEEALRCQQLN